MADRLPFVARLGRALLAFSGQDRGQPAGMGGVAAPESAPGAPVSALARDAAAAKAAFGTAALDVLPVGGLSGGTARFPTRPGDEALLRWTSENPWAHARLTVFCTAVADATYRIGTLGRDRTLDELPQEYPMWRLLEEPNPYLDGWDFRFLTMLYLKATGELYWRKVRGAPLRRPSELWVLPRHWVRVVREPGTNRVIRYQLQVPGQAVRPEDRNIPPADMVWLRSPDPLDPYLKGVGDLLAAATEIETFEYASEGDRRFMLNDAAPRIALEMPPEARPNPEDRKAIRDDWALHYGGPWNAGSVPLLWGGAKVAKLQETKKEMDFVESQRFLRDAIVAPLHKVMVGITEDVNRAQAEAAEYIFGRWHALPAANRLARAYSRVARDFDPRVLVQVDRGDLVPEDKTLKANTAQTSGPIATVDERRAMIGLPELPGGAGNVRQIGITVLEVPLGENAPEPGAPDGEGEPDERPGGGDGEGDRETLGQHFIGLIPSGKPGHVGEASVKARRPSLAELLRHFPPDVEFAALLVRRLLGAYEAVLEGRWATASAEVGISGSFDLSNPEVVRFLREEAGQRIRRIDGTTLDALRRELSEGVGAGEAIPDLARRVSSVFEAAKGARSAVIARTETLYASNRAAFIAYGESGVVPKLEWLLAPDYAPEIDAGQCEPFDGKVVEYGQEFAPGVPFPPLHPQCRCTIAPVFEGGRRLYAGEWRKQHITSLGRTHLRMERLFRNALLRGLQEQQNAALRAVRRAGLLPAAAGA